MPLYCYIIETGMYEDREPNIIGHSTKYSQEEFNDICIKLTEKYGDVEEIEYYSAYDNTDVKQIKYNIDAEDLIEHLVNEYGFVKLDVPVNDGHNTKEISRTPVPPENLRKVVVKSNTCPFEESFHVKKDDVKHPNARCVVPEMEITCSSPDSDYDLIKDETAKKISEWASDVVSYYDKLIDKSKKEENQ